MYKKRIVFNYLFVLVFLKKNSRFQFAQGVSFFCYRNMCIIDNDPRRRRTRNTRFRDKRADHSNFLQMNTVISWLISGDLDLEGFIG